MERFLSRVTIYFTHPPVGIQFFLRIEFLDKYCIANRITACAKPLIASCNGLLDHVQILPYHSYNSAHETNFLAFDINLADSLSGCWSSATNTHPGCIVYACFTIDHRDNSSTQCYYDFNTDRTGQCHLASFANLHPASPQSDSQPIGLPNTSALHYFDGDPSDGIYASHCAIPSRWRIIRG